MMLGVARSGPTRSGTTERRATCGAGLPAGLVFDSAGFALPCGRVAGRVPAAVFTYPPIVWVASHRARSVLPRPRGARGPALASLAAARGAPLRATSPHCAGAQRE